MTRPRGVVKTTRQVTVIHTVQCTTLDRAHRMLFPVGPTSRPFHLALDSSVSLES